MNKCKSCGLSLSLDEELEDGFCVQCFNNKKVMKEWHAKNKSMICPLCKESYCWHKEIQADGIAFKTTHLWVCPDCPFVGFEYYSGQDVINLKNYLK